MLVYISMHVCRAQHTHMYIYLHAHTNSNTHKCVTNKVKTPPYPPAPFPPAPCPTAPCPTAIDRAPMDKRLKGAPGLHAVLADVAAYQPKENTSYDAILSDLNGPPTESIGHVNRLAAFLKPHGLVIFTLKVPRVENLEAPCAVFDEIVHLARGAQLQLLAETHLTGNRHEFTLFFEKRRF